MKSNLFMYTFLSSNLTLKTWDRGSNTTKKKDRRRGISHSSYTSPLLPTSENVGKGSTQRNYRVYSEYPELYELAFSYRNIETEAKYMLSQWKRHAQTQSSNVHVSNPRSILEVGAGPAAHVIQVVKLIASLEVSNETALSENSSATQIPRAAAIDIEPRMKDLGILRAREAGVALEYHHLDMRQFTLENDMDGKVLTIAKEKF